MSDLLAEIERIKEQVNAVMTDFSAKMNELSQQLRDITAKLPVSPRPATAEEEERLFERAKGNPQDAP